MSWRFSSKYIYLSRLNMKIIYRRRFLWLTTNISFKCFIASSFFPRAMEYVIKTLENIVIVRRKK